MALNNKKVVCPLVYFSQNMPIGLILFPSTYAIWRDRDVPRTGTCEDGMLGLFTPVKIPIWTPPSLPIGFTSISGRLPHIPQYPHQTIARVAGILSCSTQFVWFVEQLSCNISWYISSNSVQISVITSSNSIVLHSELQFVMQQKNGPHRHQVKH